MVLQEPVEATDIRMADIGDDLQLLFDHRLIVFLDDLFLFHNFYGHWDFLLQVETLVHDCEAALTNSFAEVKLFLYVWPGVA